MFMELPLFLNSAAGGAEDWKGRVKRSSCLEN